MGFEKDPIVPDPAWGLPTPMVDPDEWVEDDDWGDDD